MLTSQGRPPGRVTPPKTPLGKALGYIDRQWKRLLLFLDDGNIEATNNRRERELRRLVLGRRNWLFAWLDDGGERTGNILSIVATCIAHDVNPRAYLHKVLHYVVPGRPQEKLRDLLPDRMLVSHPELYVGDPMRSPCRRRSTRLHAVPTGVSAARSRWQPEAPKRRSPVIESRRVARIRRTVVRAGRPLLDV